MGRYITMLHPELQAIILKFTAECKKQGLPVLVTETWRSKTEQDNLYAQGRTKPGNIVTNCKYPQSPHCWGVAFDFCRNIKGREYDNKDGFFDKVGRIAEKMFDNTEFDLFWGGDWKNFVDKPHVEMKKYMSDCSTKNLQQKYGTPENFKKTWRTGVIAPESQKGDVEVVDKTKILHLGREIEVERILKDNTNYIKLRDLEKLGFAVSYDEVRKMPVVNGQWDLK